jgi:hypothetical protein
MRAMVLTGLLVFAWSSLAAANADCPAWRRLTPDGRSAEVEGMITGHMSSHTTRKYTSENKVVIQRCLRKFAPQIVEQIDYACEDRPGANAEFVDDIFDRYLLSCI